MKRVWKYGLEISSRQQQLQVPRGAQFLELGHQEHSRHPGISLWFLVPARSRRSETRRFQVAVTGRAYRDLEIDKHLGSVVMERGAQVYHVFEVRR